MEITPQVPKNKNIISAYGENYLIIRETKIYTPVLISPDSIEYLILQDLDKIKDSFEIIILGSNSKIDRTKYDYAEIMDFGAACRTYNILLIEGRKVASMLL